MPQEHFKNMKLEYPRYFLLEERLFPRVKKAKQSFLQVSKERNSTLEEVEKYIPEDSDSEYSNLTSKELVDRLKGIIPEELDSRARSLDSDLVRLYKRYWHEHVKATKLFIAAYVTGATILLSGTAYLVTRPEYEGFLEKAKDLIEKLF